MPSAVSYESDMDKASSTHLKKRPHEGSVDSPKERKKAKHPKTDIAKSKEEQKNSSETTKKKKDKGEKKPKKGKTEKATKKQVRSSSETHNAEPPKITFPFFTQTISLWVPLYPVGFDRPISSVADQHLAGLLNQYSPLLGGYLLAYSNVNLSETSVRADPNNPPTDKTPAVLASVDEYAVGYGWMTVDVDLFVPRRGAWLEGNVILQNEGSVGVNCWEKFNASIEASRLPRGWKYVYAESPRESETAKDDHVSGTVDKADESRAEEVDEEETDKANEGGEAEQEKGDQSSLATQVHTTGYWTDESGKPVKGKILFRIKDFDVGLAGDNGYLAIEGTMLTPEEECRLVLSERDKNRTAKSRGRARRLPEFSITQFGKDDEENGAHKDSHAGTKDS